MNMNVVITERMHRSGIDFLKENDANVELLYETNRSLEDAIKDADGVVVRVAKINENLMRIGKEHKLKVIAKHGIGVDNIDVEAAKKLGIRVVNVPYSCINAVAEFALGAILLLAKDYVRFDSEVRKGNWNLRYHKSNVEIRGKTIGIIGYGNIGRTVAKFANSLGAYVFAYDRFVEVHEDYVKQVGLETLLKGSDFISIHVPLTKETYHLIGRRELEIVREGVYIVNTSRGGIVDESALCEAIERGRVSGALLDTTEQEPVTLDNPILKCRNLILTAHSAGNSDVAVVGDSLDSCRQVLQVLKGEEPPFIVA